MYNKNDDSLMFEAYKKSKEPKKTKASKEKMVALPETLFSSNR